MNSQAAGLQKMTQGQAVRVFAVTSGKGGVGKTNVSVNLSVALARMGQRVMLLDADLGMANVDVLLGLKPQWNLAHVIEGERSLEEILLTGPDGVQIIPAASGISRMAALSQAENAGLIQAFSELNGRMDILMVDTAAGISSSVTTLAAAADEVLVVVCDEPASITDAYALIKVLSGQHRVQRFHVVANMVRSPDEGRNLFRKLFTVCDRFLDVTLQFLGSIPHDEMLRKSVQRQRPVVEAFPGSFSSRAFERLARSLLTMPVRKELNGGIQFFIERVMA